MINLKNITELPVAEKAEGLNLIVNDDGAAKQIPANEVGAKADWNEKDESSPAYILNKPDVALKDDLVEKWDLDIEITFNWVGDTENGEMQCAYVVNHIEPFENIKNKILNGINPKCKAKVSANEWGTGDPSFYNTQSFDSMHSTYHPSSEYYETVEGIEFVQFGIFVTSYIVLGSNDVILYVGMD